MSSTPWYILGAGAIGCLWAGYWRQIGVDIILISPSTREKNHLSLTPPSINDNDVIINNLQSDIQSITLSEMALSSIVIEQLLICTKTQDTLQAIEKIKKNIANEATILLLQNGILSTEVTRLLNKAIAIGVTTDGAYRTAELDVVHAGRGSTYIGSLHESVDTTSLLKKLPIHFLDIHTCNDIDIRQWKKLAINCAINGLTVIFHCKNGALLQKPTAMKKIAILCQEIETVSNAMGFSSTLLADLFQQVEQTLRHTADNYSSMYQDIKLGKPTEVDYFNGYICQQAQRLSIPCPENSNIVATIKSLSKH